MSFTKNGNTYLLAIIVSLIIPFLSITLGSFAYFGLGLSFIVLSSFFYFLKENKDPKTKLYYFFTMLFSSLVFIRSEPSITFLNILATIYFGSLMVLPEKSNNIFQVIFSPLLLLKDSFLTKNAYKLESSQVSVPKTKLPEIIIGVVISVLVLALILPLLASTNPIFNKILLDILNSLNLKNLINSITLPRIFINLVRLSISFFLIIFIPKMLSFTNGKKENKEDFVFGLNLIIPKIVVAVTLLLFFITQIQLYFSSSQTLIEMGYSYSQYTREVFGQLSLVSLIVFLLVYIDRESQKLNKIFTYILVTQAVFLTLMAGKSVYEYSDKWGFTYKRLYGFSVIFWSLGIFGLFLQSTIKSSQKLFVQRVVVLTGLTLLIINFLNFDYLIYNFRKAATGQGVDYQYLTRLSSDSLSFREQLDNLVLLTPEGLDTKQKIEQYNEVSPGKQWLFFKVSVLKDKYRKLDIRTFNLLDYLQYQRIKDIDVERYRSLLNKPYPVENPIEKIN